MAIGDAAWSLDPLSGTGVKRAVADGAAAAVAVSAALKDKDSELLRAHAHARAAAFGDGLAVQGRYYAMERRWRDQPFWSRRASSQGARISLNRDFRRTPSTQDVRFAQELA
jgi:flavin-dependent dehydrogenase